MPSMKSKPWFRVIALCALVPAAHADIPAALDRASVSFGGFYPVVDARLSANGPGVAGTEVNFQRDLALDNHRTLTNARLEFLVFDSQGFSIGGYQYSKRAGAALARDIQFDGNDYNASAFVQARLRL